ncbi:MAG: D-galactarate dehydratase [Pararhodobacter sp.]|nr:D-galactarate dehydratase [Pararhodobacter sp.]
MRVIIPLLVLVLSGCGAGFSLRFAPPAPEVPVSVNLEPGEDVVRPAARPGTDGARQPATTMRALGRSAAALDTTTDTERAAATEVASGPSGAALGETLAGLGPPTEPGFWLRTGLVDRTRQGRVETAAGASVRLELRPSGNAPGSGSQISLPAIRALEAPLTQLLPLTVFALD